MAKSSLNKVHPFIQTVFILFLSFFCLAAGQKEKTKSFTILNAHEHMQSVKEAPKFLKAMQHINVSETVLLGSSEATIYSNRSGFTGWEKNNLELLKIAKTYPGHFIIFPTIDVQDPDKLQKFERFMELGGSGLKLYSGNVFFHREPLNSPSMMPVYAFCEKKQIPILFHVNAGYYQEEFEDVLKRFPKMKMICPHFCLSTIKSERFEHLMDTYPNLYTDFSFGFMDFLTAALKRFSRNPEKYRRLVLKYQDRIFFGTDMVVTDVKFKTVDWLTQVAQVYRDVLEKKEYTFFGIPNETLKGLYLDEKVLRKIYRTNFERFFYGKRKR